MLVSANNHSVELLARGQVLANAEVGPSNGVYEVCVFPVKVRVSTGEHSLTASSYETLATAPQGRLTVHGACYVFVVAHDPGIYVEILIRAGVDEIWRFTQVPDLHELWDLRFTAIDYLPRCAENDTQRFRYSTRIGFGLKIDGEGESTGTREDASGYRTSALKFWSSDPKSLIKEGSGYWRYIPTPDGVRFLTWYDYRTRLVRPAG